MKKLGEILDKYDLLLLRRPWVPYALLCILYIIIQFPKQILITNFDEIVFPLQSLAASQQLLFTGFHIRKELADTLITPVNAALIYPPGIYAIAACLGSVESILAFLTWIQFCVPLLIYWLLVRFVPPTTGLLVASMGIYYFTNAGWWAPDFLIQPMMILALISIGLGRSVPCHRARDLIFTGILLGVIGLLKQNVALFFGILVSTWLFLSSFRPPDATLPPSVAAKYLSYLFLIGVFALGVIFSLHIVYLDEAVYYLLPYALFWILLAKYVIVGPTSLDVPAFLRAFVIMVGFALAFPLLVFIRFGHIVGYNRYFHSLFGMGLQFVQVWDKGIIGAIRDRLSFAGIAATYGSVASVFLYLLPLLVAMFVVVHLYLQSRSVLSSFEHIKALFRHAALPVVALLMLFPLESDHILVTKLFIFVIIGFHFLRLFHPASMRAVTLLVGAALIPVLGYAVARDVAIARLATSRGTPELQRMIGLPMESNLAGELEKQLNVLHRTIEDRPYYVIDSSGATLWSLAAFQDTKLPQYYLEMRRGVLDPESVNAIKVDLDRRPFVVVNKADYHRYIQHASDDPYLAEVLAYVRSHFVQVGAYDAPESRPASIAHIVSFIVMRKK